MRSTLMLMIFCAGLFAQGTRTPGNLVVEGTVNFCADAGISDTYTCSLSPALTSYITGSRYVFKANTANTGASTININSVGAKAIKKSSGTGVTTDLETGDILAGQLVEVVYDGTNMQMVSRTAGGSVPVANVVSYGALGDGSTDDSTAIQAAATALANGGLLYFPKTAAGRLEAVICSRQM